MQSIGIGKTKEGGGIIKDQRLHPRPRRGRRPVPNNFVTTISELSNQGIVRCLFTTLKDEILGSVATVNFREFVPIETPELTQSLHRRGIMSLFCARNTSEQTLTKVLEQSLNVPRHKRRLPKGWTTYGFFSWDRPPHCLTQDWLIGMIKSNLVEEEDAPQVFESIREQGINYRSTTAPDPNRKLEVFTAFALSEIGCLQTIPPALEAAFPNLTTAENALLVKIWNSSWPSL